MFCKRKKLTSFKSRVRKKLKNLKKVLKAKLDYIERLNNENSKLVDDNNNFIKNIQATIDQKNKEIETLKQNQVFSVKVNNIWEKKFDTLMNIFNEAEDKRLRGIEKISKLEKDLEIANNRIKYEFKGE